MITMIFVSVSLASLGLRSSLYWNTSSSTMYLATSTTAIEITIAPTDCSITAMKPWSRLRVPSMCANTSKTDHPMIINAMAMSAVAATT